MVFVWLIICNIWPGGSGCYCRDKYQGQPTSAKRGEFITFPLHSSSSQISPSEWGGVSGLAWPCILSSHKDEKSSATTLDGKYDENGDTSCNTLTVKGVKGLLDNTIHLALLLFILTSIVQRIVWANFKRVRILSWTITLNDLNLEQKSSQTASWPLLMADDQRDWFKKSNFSHHSLPTDDSFRCCQGLKIICVCVFLSDFIDHEPFQITPGKTPPVCHATHRSQFTSAVSCVTWRTCHVMTRSNVSRDTGNYPGGGHRDIASCAPTPRPVSVCHQSSVSLIKPFNELLNQKTKTACSTSALLFLVENIGTLFL